MNGDQLSKTDPSCRVHVQSHVNLWPQSFGQQNHGVPFLQDQARPPRRPARINHDSIRWSGQDRLAAATLELFKFLAGGLNVQPAGRDHRIVSPVGSPGVGGRLFETFGGFGNGVRRLLRQAADQLSNKLSHAQHLDEVTWTTKNWHGLQMQRLSVVLHTAVAWQTVNELACGESGIVHGAECIAVLNGVA